MLTKPSQGQTIAYKARNIWRGIWQVKWTDSLNYPNTFQTLFRRVDGVWCSGENFPDGVRNSGLIRAAHPVIATLLDKQS